MIPAIAAIPWSLNLSYLIAGVLFILALRGLSNPRFTRTGGRCGMAAMAAAAGATLYVHNAASLPEIGVAIVIGSAIGFFLARATALSAAAPFVAALLGVMGLVAMLVGIAACLDPAALGVPDVDAWPVRFGIGLGMAFGAIGFSGSLAVCLTLRNAPSMPAMLSLLSGCSGWAAAALGFAFQNMAMVLIGALVGASGTALAGRLRRGDAARP